MRRNVVFLVLLFVIVGLGGYLVGLKEGFDGSHETIAIYEDNVPKAIETIQSQAERIKKQDEVITGQRELIDKSISIIEGKNKLIESLQKTIDELRDRGTYKKPPVLQTN